MVQFPAGAREFHFLQNVQTGSGTHQSSIQWIMGAVYSGIKRSKSEADHLPPFFDVHRDNFAYTAICFIGCGIVCLCPCLREEHRLNVLQNKPLRRVRRGADKSLARPGRTQATATKLRIYSTYSPRSSIHSSFCKPLKNIQMVVRPTRSPRQQ